jgi:hypothetical protein
MTVLGYNITNKCSVGIKNRALKNLTTDLPFSFLKDQNQECEPQF